MSQVSSWVQVETGKTVAFSQSTDQSYRGWREQPPDLSAHLMLGSSILLFSSRTFSASIVQDVHIILKYLR